MRPGASDLFLSARQFAAGQVKKPPGHRLRDAGSGAWAWAPRDPNYSLLPTTGRVTASRSDDGPTRRRRFDATDMFACRPRPRPRPASQSDAYGRRLLSSALTMRANSTRRTLPL